jgi:predicted DNA-binding antitoxin AbrB/MazE fold protein
MTLTLKATVENGQLKLSQPVALAEGTTVRVTITPMAEPDDPLAGVLGIGESGRTDGADNHDRYLYGTRKRR